MSSINHIARSFSQLYCDIDKIETQIGRISCNASLSSVDSCSVATENVQNDGKKDVICTAQLNDIIKAAKELNRETKKFTNIERKQMEKAKSKMPKSIYLKSTMPPIWDKKKLDTYIENVMNELDLDMEVDTDLERNHKSDEVKQTKSILKNKLPHNSKRNIGTNVKFIVQNKNNDSQKKPEKPQNIDTTKVNKPATKSTSVMANIEFFNQKKCLTDHQSQDSKSTSTLVNKPPKLMFSPLTVTSTNCSIDDYENIKHNIVESNLATAHEVKQMTKCVLPPLSVKGSCKIQRIYQLEISPTQRTLEINESQCENKNVRLYKFSHSPITQEKPQEQMPEHRDASQETDRQEREVNVIEGKVHFVLDNERTTARKRRKTKLGKLKPSLNKFKNSPTPCKNKNSIEHDEMRAHKTQKNKIEFFNSDSTSIYYSSSSSDDEEVTKAVLNQMSNSTKTNRKTSSTPTPRNCKKFIVSDF